MSLLDGPRDQSTNVRSYLYHYRAASNLGSVTPTLTLSGSARHAWTLAVYTGCRGSSYYELANYAIGSGASPQTGSVTISAGSANRWVLSGMAVADTTNGAYTITVAPAGSPLENERQEQDQAGASSAKGVSSQFEDYAAGAAARTNSATATCAGRTLAWVEHGVAIVPPQTVDRSLSEDALSLSDSIGVQARRSLSEPAVTIAAETLTRTVQRLLSEAAVSIPAESLNRIVDRILSEASISFSDNLVKSVMRNISLNEDAVTILTESLARQVTRILAESSIVISAESAVRQVRRVLSEASVSISTESLMRRVDRGISEDSVLIPQETVARQVERALSETPTSIADEILVRRIQRALEEVPLSFSDYLELEVIPGGPTPPKLEEVVPKRRRWRWLPPIGRSYSLEFPLVGLVAKPYELTYPLTIEVARTYELSHLLQGDIANRFKRSYPLTGSVSKSYRVVLDLSGTVARTHEATVQLSGHVARRYEKLLTLRGEVRRSYQAEFELTGIVQDAFTQYALYKAILDLIEEDEDQ